MAGVAAGYPTWDQASAGPLNLAGRVDVCRVRHQQAAPLAVEHPDQLALLAYIGLQSRGMPAMPKRNFSLRANPDGRGRNPTANILPKSDARNGQDGQTGRTGVQT